MSKVEFKDNTIQVESAMLACVIQALEETSGELESQVKRNTAVATGQLKNSWTHQINAVENGESTATIGSPLENAIWEEFGTGEYALHGDGRKGGWYYEDAEGNGHFTHGKHPRRAFWNAYTTLKSKLVKHIQDVLKGGMS